MSTELLLLFLFLFASVFKMNNASSTTLSVIVLINTLNLVAWVIQNSIWMHCELGSNESLDRFCPRVLSNTYATLNYIPSGSKIAFAWITIVVQVFWIVVALEHRRERIHVMRRRRAERAARNGRRQPGRRMELI